MNNRSLRSVLALSALAALPIGGAATSAPLPAPSSSPTRRESQRRGRPGNGDKGSAAEQERRIAAAQVKRASKNTNRARLLAWVADV